jgi:molybdopterin-containing oxidoreductase family membrane subunit
LLLIVATTFAVATGISVLPWLKQHIVASTVIASFCVVIGMWLERWNIVVPTMTHPRLIRWSGYNPTTTEWALTVASLALFAFLFLVFFKLFPPVSIWEVAEGRVIGQSQAQVQVPLPESSTPVRRRLGITRR